MSTNNVENRELRPDNQGDCVKRENLWRPIYFDWVEH
jgi:hypothetical protein